MPQATKSDHALIQHTFTQMAARIGITDRRFPGASETVSESSPPRLTVEPCIYHGPDQVKFPAVKVTLTTGLLKHIARVLPEDEDALDDLLSPAINLLPTLAADYGAHSSNLHRYF